jgi:hypothetical protein
MNLKNLITTTALSLLGASAINAQTNFAGIDWYSGLDPSDHPLEVSGGTMTSDMPGNTTIVGYFAPVGSPVQIGVGEGLRFEYTISYAGTMSSGGVRFGLLNTDITPGARISADGFVQTHTSFSGSPTPRGAAVWSDSIAANATATIRRRNTNNSQNILNSSTQYSTADSVPASTTFRYAESIVADREYHTVFEIWNDGINDNRFVARQWYMDGENEVVIYDMIFTSDVANAYIDSLDTVAFRIGGIADSFTLSNLSIALVPEPSSWSLILGIGGMGLVLLRRRSRR